MDLALIYKGDGHHRIHATDCGDIRKDIQKYRRHNTDGRPEVISVESKDELGEYLFSIQAEEMHTQGTDEYWEEIRSQLEDEEILSCVKWPTPKLKSKEESTEDDLVLGTYEVTISVGGSLFYIEVEAAQSRHTTDMPVPCLRIASYSVKDYQNVIEKRKRAITIDGVSCFFETFWRKPMTDLEERLSFETGWYLASYNKDGIFHQKDHVKHKGLKSGSPQYNAFIKVIKQVLEAFARISPEWEEVSYARYNKEGMESATQRIRKIEEEKERLLDMRQSMCDDFNKAMKSPDIATWFEEES